jgi:hypothetical protein
MIPDIFVKYFHKNVRDHERGPHAAAPAHPSTTRGRRCAFPSSGLCAIGPPRLDETALRPPRRRQAPRAAAPVRSRRPSARFRQLRAAPSVAALDETALRAPHRRQAPRAAVPVRSRRPSARFLSSGLRHRRPRWMRRARRCRAAAPAHPAARASSRTVGRRPIFLSSRPCAIGPPRRMRRLSAREVKVRVALGPVQPLRLTAVCRRTCGTGVPMSSVRRAPSRAQPADSRNPRRDVSDSSAQARSV